MAHWTERAEDFAWAVLDDFRDDLRAACAARGITQTALAAILGVSKARVSMALGGAESPTLRSVGRWARALGCKVALVLYDDGDAANAQGPIPATFFRQLWEAAGRPRDQWGVDAAVARLRGGKGAQDGTDIVG